MIGIEKYVDDLIAKLKTRFEERLVYVGLQGSYLRGEATEESDIDIMTVIDGLSISDMDAYRDIIRSMPCADKSCGFICSREDLRCWGPQEILHLLHSTGDRYGELVHLVPEHTDADVRYFVKKCIGDLYHELCHRYIHGKPENTVAALPVMYKGVFFILQDKHYLESGRFIGKRSALLTELCGLDRDVMMRSMQLKEDPITRFVEDFRLLFTWCQKTLASL